MQTSWKIVDICAERLMIYYARAMSFLILLHYKHMISDLSIYQFAVGIYYQYRPRHAINIYATIWKCSVELLGYNSLLVPSTRGEYTINDNDIIRYSICMSTLPNESGYVDPTTTKSIKYK